MSTTTILANPGSTESSMGKITLMGDFPISSLRTSLSSADTISGHTTAQNSAITSEPKTTSIEGAASVPSVSFNFTPTVIPALATESKKNSSTTGLSLELDERDWKAVELLFALQQRRTCLASEESISAAQSSTSRGKGKGRKRARASRANGSNASKRRKVATAEGTVSVVAITTNSSETTSQVSDTPSEGSSSSPTSLESTSELSSQAPSRVASARRRRSPITSSEPSSIVARVKQVALEKAQAKAAKALAEAQAKAEST